MTGIVHGTIPHIVGIPVLTNRRFLSRRYNPDGTYSNLVRVEQTGICTAWATVFHNSDRKAKDVPEPVEVEKIVEVGEKRKPFYRRYKENPAVEQGGACSARSYARV